MKHVQRLLIGALAIGVIAALVTAGSQALFTDSDAVGSNTFNTGTVSLTTSPTSAI